MTNVKLLQEIIAKSGFQKDYIAKSIGITVYSLAKKIRNENEFKASEINGLCEVLGIQSVEERVRIFFFVRK